MRKYILIFILSGLLAAITSAQENTPTNFYAMQPQILNPAHTGQNNLGVYLNHRNQWYGLRDAPEYLNVGAHGTVNQNFGIGLNFNRYTAGIFAENTLSASVSYLLTITTDNLLRFGTSLGTNRNKIIMPDDGVSDNSDITLNTNYFDETLIKAGFGVSYSFKNRFQIDVSLPEIHSVKNDKYFQSVIAYGAYNYRFNAIGKAITVTPAIMYRFNPYSLTTLDATLTLDMENTLWLIAGYRNTSGMLIGAGIRSHLFGFAYSYEMDNSPMQFVSKGTHEITAYYYIKTKKNQ